MKYPHRDEAPALKHPTDKFNVHDPHHVTLQLLQEVHSQRMQMQIDRDHEREMRRITIEENAQQRLDQEGRHSAASNARDERERDLTTARIKAELGEKGQEGNTRKLLATLRKCGELGNSKAAIYARNEMERWK